MPDDSDEKSQALIKITDVFGLSKGTEHLARAIERGVGNVFAPWQKRRIANTEIANFERWSQALERTGLAPKAAELSLSDRALVRVVAEDIRQQENREAVAIAAAAEVKQTVDSSQSSSSPLEVEWVDRFWRLAQDVTNADMQAVWGRILARQSTGRARFSPRCLEAVSLLTRDEIVLLERLATFLWSGNANGKPCLFILHSTDAKQGRSRVPNIERQIAETVGDLRQEIIGPAGIAVDSGSGWAQTAILDFHSQLTHIRIGTKKFTLSVPNVSGPTNIGACLGISPLGGEIFGLITTTPNPHYIELVTEAFRSSQDGILRPDQNEGRS